MTEEINKSYHDSMSSFNLECKKRFGLRPIEDDHLIVDAAVQFSSYLKTFTRLDLTIAWHKQFVDTMIKVKVDTLDKRIIQKYGTHKEYLDRMQRRLRPCREKDKRVSVAK